MKMKSVKAFLSIVTAASLAVSAPAAVFAEDAAAQEAEAQEKQPQRILRLPLTEESYQ